MAARTLLEIFDKHNPAMQGKTKNLVWYNAQQKFMGIAVHETYEYAEACAAARSISDDRCKEISMAASGKAYGLPPLPKAGTFFEDVLDCFEKFSTSFDVSPSMEMVANPDYDSEESEIEARRLNPISGGSMTFSLGEGMLNFLYADFDAYLTDAETQCDPEHQQIDFHCACEAEQQLFDYYCLEKTVQQFRAVLWSSVYTMACPPFMCQRTKKELSEYIAYLKALQKKLSDCVEFIFDPDYYPGVLGKMTAQQRYAYYCKLMGCNARCEYTYAFDFPSYGQNPLSQYISLADLVGTEIETDDPELQEFCKRYHTTDVDAEAYQHDDSKLITGFQCDSLEEMLMFELWQMMLEGVKLRKCKRCGKYFIMKGNYEANYCDRAADGTNRTCQELAAQENYKKKMADNAAIPLYQKYYKRYAARVRVKQIKEPDFKKWKYQAMTKRDECTDGKITLQEFEIWMEDSFPNRKHKETESNHS